MAEEEFEKFSTDFGKAMKVLKHQKTDVIEILQGFENGMMDRETAVFLNQVTNLNIEFEEEDRVNMSTSVEEFKKKMKITGAIEAYRECGKSDEDIINKIMQNFDVARDYVVALLAPQKI